MAPRSGSVAGTAAAAGAAALATASTAGSAVASAHRREVVWHDSPFGFGAAPVRGLREDLGVFRLGRVYRGMTFPGGVSANRGECRHRVLRPAAPRPKSGRGHVDQVWRPIELGRGTRPGPRATCHSVRPNPSHEHDRNQHRPGHGREERRRAAPGIDVSGEWCRHDLHGPPHPGPPRAPCSAGTLPRGAHGNRGSAHTRQEHNAGARQGAPGARRVGGGAQGQR